MTTATTTEPRAVVEAFLGSIDDLGTALEYLADDVVYENIGTFPLPTFRSRESAGRFLRAGFSLCTGFRIVTHRIAADGPIVMTERTDSFVFGDTEAGFWVCGTFEVRDGKIVAWRDYFDNGNFALALARGLGVALGRKLLRR